LQASIFAEVLRYSGRFAIVCMVSEPAVTSKSFVIAFVGLVREILGNGTILGFEIFGGFYQPCTMFIMPAGAFIVLGCTIALYQAIHLRMEAGKEGKK
ncbi:MAG: hypothetical protein IJN58_05770, partial [Clostridia bacterium]|nr:hypothetical protein [Clostridia bacterium]